MRQNHALGLSAAYLLCAAYLRPICSAAYPRGLTARVAKYLGMNRPVASL